MAYIFCAILSSAAFAKDDLNVLGSSPNGKITIQRRRAGDAGQYVDFVNAKNGKLLFSYRSAWRNTSLVWEQNGQLLCVNDQIATSGDFIYIFKLTSDGSITLLRSPNCEDFSFNLRQMLSTMNAPGRFTFIGKKWLHNSQLLAVVSGGFYGESQFETVLQINKTGEIQVIKPKIIR